MKGVAWGMDVEQDVMSAAELDVVEDLEAEYVDLEDQSSVGQQEDVVVQLIAVVVVLGSVFVEMEGHLDVVLRVLALDVDVLQEGWDVVAIHLVAVVDLEDVDMVGLISLEHAVEPAAELVLMDQLCLLLISQLQDQLAITQE